MEIDFLKNKFTINEAMQLNPLVLAFIGDAIYEVFVRTYLVDEHRDMSAHKLHVKAVSFVKAHSQSELMKEMMDILTEEECRIFKRGRNAKSGTVPKNADVTEYRMATGFEALMGFLYLTNQLERLNELMNIIVKIHK
ncbi:Mini-ribonuclease 3 [Clostridium botulinum]|uniref:Mini-ribonuclease 3 n=1 Tax=Clostridium botulinum TaxID=1491 RepID=A0A9Q1UZ44_CLOBO|nr:Mini-ribonuclease 3 [Clostridium botulinum]AEB74887.1 RNase3 domain protein [Clostridium botulinum BKT015925]KEI03390.1 Mini-ribonuclease 3 [Clostridium botulinum C/D str. Sp77]KEI03724.1 Mini-ribonuclease 3 [Clostridium botulinum D str. 16868]KLU76744.1 Mini-ribonuclease 3 [Clostridium botulinum V891]KOA75794.1 Mini-ribonuclease 3 [Clostridium botulinum]